MGRRDIVFAIVAVSHHLRGGGVEALLPPNLLSQTVHDVRDLRKRTSSMRMLPNVRDGRKKCHMDGRTDVAV